MIVLQHKVLLCLCFVLMSYSDILPLTTIVPSVISDLFYSPQAMSNHVVTVSGTPNTNVNIVLYASNLSSNLAITTSNILYDTNAQIRTGPFNSLATITTFSLIYFTDTTLTYFPFFGNLNSQLFNTSSNLVIKDVCFGSTRSIIYALIHDPILNIYLLYFFTNTSYINQTLLTGIDPMADLLDEFIFDADRLFLVFSSKVVVYGCVGYSLGAPIVTLTYPPLLLQYIDAKVYTDLLIYSSGMSVYLYNLTTLTQIQSYTCTNLIESITKISNYILIKTSPSIEQYDIDIGQVISVYASNVTLQKIQTLDTGQFISWRDQLSYLTDFQLLAMSSDYPASGTPCLSTYSLNGTLCVKTGIVSNVTVTPIPAITTPIANPSANTSSASSTTNSQLTYIDIATMCLFILSLAIPGYIYTLSAWKTMPRFLLVFTLLVNDLVLYQYHRKIEPAYPNSTLIFMEKFDILKQLGIQSLENYLPFLNAGHEQLQDFNSRTLTRLQFTEHDPQQVYFLYALTDFCLSCLLLNTLYFLALKLAHLLLYWLRHQHLVLRKCYLFIRNQSKWWVLLVAILEMNFTDLVLAASLQLLQPVSLCFFDKLNLAAMLLAFFVAVFYALAFYGLVYASQKHRNSKTLIVYCKQRQMPSYFFEPALVLVRSVSKTFTHGFLLCSYSAQIASLLLLDVCFLVLCLYRLRSFRNKPIACLLTAYFLGFLLFDLFFVAEIYTDVTKMWDRELIGFIICCSLAGISLLMCLYFMISSLISSCKFLKDSCNLNRIFSINRLQNIQASIGKNIFFKRRKKPTMNLSKIRNKKSIQPENPLQTSPKNLKNVPTKYRIITQKRRKSGNKLKVSFQPQEKDNSASRVHGIVQIKLKRGKREIGK